MGVMLALFRTVLSLIVVATAICASRGRRPSRNRYCPSDGIQGRASAAARRDKQGGYTHRSP